MAYPEKQITNLDEITEADVTYIRPSGQYVRIENDNLGDGPCFTIHRKGLYNFVTQGDKVRSWKTLAGAIRFVKKNFTL